MIKTLLNEVFRQGGVMTSLGFSYRPSQHEFALQLGDWMDVSRPERERVPMQLAEVGTGVGKTLVYVVAAAIARCLPEDDGQIRGARGLVTTYTRALRDEITELEPVVNTVIKQLAQHDLASRPITIRSVNSITAIASRSAAESLVRSFNPQNGLFSDARAYLDAIIHAETVLERPYLLTEWLEDGQDFKFFYEGRGGSPEDKLLSALVIQSGEFNRKVKTIPGFLDYKQRNDSTKRDADIVVATHTMFILNGMLLGGVLSTNKRKVRVPVRKNQFDEGKGTREIDAHLDRFNVFIDEADQFTHQTATMMNTSVDTQQIDALYVEAMAARANSRERKGITNLESVLKNHRLGFDHISRNVSMLSDQTEIVNAAKVVYRDLLATFVEDSTYHGTIQADRAVIMAGSLRKIINLVDLLGGSSLDAAAIDKAMVEMAVQRLAAGYRISIAATQGSHLVSRSWRNFRSHGFASIVLLSGTLRDANNVQDSFVKMVGIIPSDEKRKEFADNVGKEIIHIPTTGKADRIVVCDGPPGEPWAREVATQSENNQTTMELTEEYADHIASVVRSATADEAGLVLVTSYGRLKLLRERLGENSYIIQHRGERSADFVTRVEDARAEHPQKSAICLFWSGVNFVRPSATNPHDKYTMFRKLIVPMLPLYPLATPHGRMSMYRDSRTEAYWKIKQGMGRIFRHPTRDLNGEIWIGDPRFRPNQGICAKFKAFDASGRKFSFDPLFDDITKPTTTFAHWRNGVILEEV